MTELKTWSVEKMPRLYRDHDARVPPGWFYYEFRDATEGRTGREVVLFHGRGKLPAIMAWGSTDEAAMSNAVTGIENSV